MDHIALAVSSAADLGEWTAWLDQHGVEHSEVVESDLGHHLNLRAPDGIAVELFVLGGGGDEVCLAAKAPRPSSV